MTLPPQLAEGLRRRRELIKKGIKPPPRPICEQLPSVNAYRLQIPRDSRVFTAPNISLRYPFLSGLRLSWDAVEFRLRSLHRRQKGRLQTFALKRIRTGFGVRHVFICTCERAVTKLYKHEGRLACRHCHGAIAASKAINQQQRPAVQASRLQSILDKAKLYNRTREHLTKRFGEMVTMHKSLRR